MVRLDKNFKAHLIRKWSARYLEYDTLKSYLQHEHYDFDKPNYREVVHHFLSVSGESTAHVMGTIRSAIRHKKQGREKSDSDDMENNGDLLDDQSKKQRDVYNPGTRKEKAKRWEESKFVVMFLAEVKRVASFYDKKLDDLEQQLSASLEKANEQGVFSSMETNDGLSKAIRKQKKDRELSVLRAYISIYKKLDELESFAFLNVMLCIKILKKHDKLRADHIEPLFPNLMDSAVYPASFGECVQESNTRLHIVRKRTIALCADFCCDGDLVEAKGKLRMSKGGHTEHDSWYLGYKIGVVTLLLLWFVWDAYMDPGEGRTLWNDPAIYLYSFLGNLVVYDWLWGINVYLWERSHVNYLVLLDLNSDHSPSPHEIFTEASYISMIYLANLILYYKARRNHLYTSVAPHYFPLGLALMYILYGVVHAVQQRHHASHRLYSPSVIFRIITSPFSSVTLRENYTADVMTSCIKVFSNCAFAACYIISGAYDDESSSLHTFGTCDRGYMSVITGLLAILPLWFRFAQCLRRVYDTSLKTAEMKYIVWPHSYNALKYLMGMIVVFLGLAHPLQEHASTAGLIIYKVVFIIFLVCTTLYQFYWDVYNDWGLMQIMPTWSDLFTLNWSKLGSHVFLRRNLMYKKSTVYYYVAIVLDLVLRAMWTLSLIPQGTSGSPFSYSLGDQLGPFLATFELCRRCIWGTLKLECEHINAGTRGHVVALHLERNNSASKDPNRDLKIAFYHLVVGLLALTAVVFIIISMS